MTTVSDPQPDAPETDEVEAAPQRSQEMDILLPDPAEPFELSGGQRVRTVRLATRETLALLRILTKGAGDVLAQARFSADMEEGDFIGLFVGSVLLSIPEAEDETIEFVQRMVRPEHYIDQPRSGPELEANDQMLRQLYTVLVNPPLEDTEAILTRIAIAEAPHVMALGKRLASLLAAQKKTMAPKAKSASTTKKSKNSSAKSG